VVLLAGTWSTSAHGAAVSPGSARVRVVRDGPRRPLVLRVCAGRVSGAWTRRRRLVSGAPPGDRSHRAAARAFLRRWVRNTGTGVF